MRVRENAESIAFYGGEASEQRLLWQRLSAVIKNYAELLSTSRNLEFFTSSYRSSFAGLPDTCKQNNRREGKMSALDSTFKKDDSSMHVSMQPYIHRLNKP